jgi:hypothetical protein
MSILPVIFELAGQIAVNVAMSAGILRDSNNRNSKKEARKEIRAAKQAEKTARLDEVIKETNAWELAISQVIEAKAEGFTPPEWAVSTIMGDSKTATAILYECQKSAMKSHVVKDVNAEGYDERLANHGIQHLTVHAPRAVENRLDLLADIFIARTCDHQYRKTLIRSVVSYGVRKSKAIEKKFAPKA